MKRRYFISLLFATATASTAIGPMVMAQDHSRIVPFKPRSADDAAILKLFADRAKPDPIKPVITELVIADGYGLVNQVTGETGGQVLIRQDTQQGWQIVRGTGGRLDRAFMVKQGCPEATAKTLVKLIQAQTKEHYEIRQKRHAKPH